jgi:hypothetical protein
LPAADPVSRTSWLRPRSALIRPDPPEPGTKEAAVTTLHRHPQETDEARAARVEEARRAHDERVRRSRLRRSLLLATVFLAASGLFAWWAADSLTDHQWFLDILSGVSMVLFLVEAFRAFTLWRRGRH